MDTQKAKRVLRSIHKISHKHFVLHGSLTRSNTILARKPSLDTWRNTRKAKGIREKGVYATRLVDLAVLYATLPNDTMWRRVKKGRYIRILYQKPELILFRGFIHVCRADSFDKRALITVSKRSVKVVRTFRITPEVFMYLWEKKQLRIFDRP